MKDEINWFGKVRFPVLIRLGASPAVVMIIFTFPPLGAGCRGGTEPCGVWRK